MINESNIETYIIEYLDGELDQEHIDQLLQVIAQNPAYAQMLEAYRSAYLSIDDEAYIFPDKELLLRKEPRSMKLWIPIGLAAGLAAVVGVFLLMKPDNGFDQPPAQDIIAQQADQLSQPVPANPVTDTLVPSHQVRSTGNAGHHLYANQKQDKKNQDDPQPGSHRPEQVGAASPPDAYASIEKIQLTTLPRNIEYHQEIHASYVTVIKDNNPVPRSGHSGIRKTEDELEVKVAGVVFNQDVQQIKNIQDKFDKLKERFTDNLAQLSGISFTLSK